MESNENNLENPKIITPFMSYGARHLNEQDLVKINRLNKKLSKTIDNLGGLKSIFLINIKNMIKKKETFDYETTKAYLNKNREYVVLIDTRKIKDDIVFDLLNFIEQTDSVYRLYLKIKKTELEKYARYKNYFGVIINDDLTSSCSRCYIENIDDKQFVFEIKCNNLFFKEITVESLKKNLLELKNLESIEVKSKIYYNKGFYSDYNKIYNPYYKGKYDYYRYYGDVDMFCNGLGDCYGPYPSVLSTTFLKLYENDPSLKFENLKVIKMPNENFNYRIISLFPNLKTLECRKLEGINIPSKTYFFSLKEPLLHFPCIEQSENLLSDFIDVVDREKLDIITKHQGRISVNNGELTIKIGEKPAKTTTVKKMRERVDMIKDGSIVKECTIF